MERLIQKDRLKDAVKQAKLCFKEENTPENHQLLERAYFLRARQLLQLGMPDSAVEVAQHLLEFGITSGEWVDEFVRLLMSLGLAAEAFQIQGRSGNPELKDQLEMLAADQAVIHPDRMQDVPLETTREASLIRESLEKLRAGDETGGLLLLRDLPRSSLLADWKLFVRGLAAYYRGDTVETQANWDRLDGKRKARQIALRLSRLGHSDGMSTDDTDLIILEKETFGEPVLARLAELRKLAADHDWEKMIRLLGPLRLSLRRVDRRLAERLTRILFGPLLSEASNLDTDDADVLLSKFTRVAEPMAIDPSWNRFWGIASDFLDVDSDVSRDRWVKYIDDLETIPAFSPADRPLAQALVWNSVALSYRNDAEQMSSPLAMMMMSCFSSVPFEEDEDGERLKKEAVECLERSLALAPCHLPTYRLLVDAHRHWKNPAELESATRRLLERFPDDLETLTLMVESLIERDELDEAMLLVQRARAGKPLDQTWREREGAIRIGLARHRALAGRWDEGREQFRAAEELLPDLCRQYHYLARKVLFEAKASQRDASDRFLREAQAALPEPAPLWLALAIESSRYAMSPATTKGYGELWAGALKKKCQSQTAGEMAWLLKSYLDADVDYPGRTDHTKRVASYLNRTTRLKYRQIDIERVCDFLCALPEQKELLGKLLYHGLRHHPGSVSLNFQSGLKTLAKSQPPFIEPAAMMHLEKALTLAEASSDPAETALLPSIKNALTMINELISRVSRHPFGGGPFSFPGNDFESLDQFDYDDLDVDVDDYDDDDEFDPSPVWLPSPRPLPAKKKKRKKR